MLDAYSAGKMISQVPSMLKLATSTLAGYKQ